VQATPASKLDVAGLVVITQIQRPEHLGKYDSDDKDGVVCGATLLISFFAFLRLRPTLSDHRRRTV
jgi:hypothetical protein